MEAPVTTPSDLGQGELDCDSWANNGFSCAHCLLGADRQWHQNFARERRE